MEMAVQHQYHQQEDQQSNNQKTQLPTGPSLTTTPPTNTITASATATSTNGPRVSFNRDVHVKRIGKRRNEDQNYHFETTNLQPPSTQHLRRELPTDLSAEGIRKEAALVVAQAERLKCKAAGVDSNLKGSLKKRDSIPNKFHSLPSRKKKGPTKATVARSVSDASAKKSKRPSIFSIFSRKSDTNINQIERDPRFEGSGGRLLVRSKSDAGSYKEQRNSKQKKTKEDKQQEPLSGSAKQLPPSQLTPIIENAQKEDYFEEQFNRERRKSEAITESEKHATELKGILERESPQKLSGNIGFTHHDDLDLVPSKPISENIKETISTLQAKQSQSKSTEDMHSSQLPQQKPPLTKGLTVNGMVKRLSMERFSPPPTISSPAFSYTRPNEGIIYAQLASDEDPSNHLHQPKSSPSRETVRASSASQDIRHGALNRISADRTDYSTSHHNQLHSNYTNGSRVTIESPMRNRIDSYAPSSGPTTIRIEQSVSPSPWQQLSPRNLSDEDEGLGIETRKYVEEEPALKPRSKSPYEPPIIPVIRSVTPTQQSAIDHRRVTDHAYPYRSNSREPAADLGRRRALLESRILTRRFATHDTIERSHQRYGGSPEQNREVREYSHDSTHRNYLTPERDELNPRFHKLHSSEILNKYSPERSHLDMVAPTAAMPSVMAIQTKSSQREQKTSRYVHTKYFDDGTGGVKEVYERETRMDDHGQPYVHESRRRERLDSLSGKREQSSDERQQITDYEPKSLDSQFASTDMYRSSPENLKRYDGGAGKHNFTSEDHWQSSLTRDKHQQRSFDKGDSGIENDFRKESFNGDISNRWRKRTAHDDIKACETFIKKERRHTEEQYPRRKNSDYVYRERSIDDGSHFDPRLDKYPTTTSTLMRSNKGKNSSNTERQDFSEDTLKRSKKLGGFEKVKQLFTGGGSTRKKEAKANSATHYHSSTLPKDKYMVKEEEMRLRYREHRGSLQNDLREPKTMDISMRRRLSTPKASPLLLKRTSSEKTRKQSPLTLKNSNTEGKPEKLSWFKSLDRRSKSKSKEKLENTANGEHETSSIKRKTYRTPPAPPIPSKNLRFFGDTDLDSNPPTISKAATSTSRSRPSVSTLKRTQKYSQSAYHLDRINGSPSTSVHLPAHLPVSSVASSRTRSTSLHNLENDHNGAGMDEVDYRKRRHYSRSRNLDDISESGSDTEEKPKRQSSSTVSRSLSRERLDRSHRYDDHAYRRSSDRQMTDVSPRTMHKSEPASQSKSSAASTLPKQQQQHQLLGPPKPARSADRRVMSSFSRERDRLPADSSGTEGESSLHSQRSVVYLHATTVGAIPQPYQMSSRRRSISRDDLRGKGKSANQPLTPMTRSVSRSVSMLAPWTPKHMSEGYEINYSQEQNERAKPISTLPRKQHLYGGLNSSKKPSVTEPPSSRLRRNQLMKDDQSSIRNSSSTSASKSGISANLRNGDVMDSSRKDVFRRKVK